MKGATTVFVDMTDVCVVAQMMMQDQISRLNMSKVIGYALTTLTYAAKARGIARPTEQEALARLDLMGMLPKSMEQLLQNGSRQEQNLKTGVSAVELAMGLEQAKSDYVDPRKQRASKELPKLDMSTIPVVSDEPSVDPGPQPPEHLRTLWSEFNWWAGPKFSPGTKIEDLMQTYEQEKKPEQKLWSEIATWLKTVA